jgi:carboxypeptidase C (cathepsin A)
MHKRLLALTSALVLSANLSAQEAPPAPAPEKKPTPKESKAEKDGRDPETKPKESKGSIKIEGKTVAYTAKTGILPVYKEDGTVGASIFYVYYSQTNEYGYRDPKLAAHTRPVTFCFNGGPGSSAVWLHLGGLGPKRVNTLLDGRRPDATSGLVDNPHSVLDVTDLVFIDPVNTGLSRAAKGESDKQFLGVDEDINAVAEFIRVFCIREKRWESPKFLCGESYGGIRGAGLTATLQEKHGIYLNGLQIVSGLLNYGPMYGAIGNDLPHVLELPTLTNIAHAHGKLPEDLQADREAAEKESREFATNEYSVALLKGSALPEADRKKVADKLSRLTSLPVPEILESNLRIDRWAFKKRLLRKEGLIIGGYDARVTAEDVNNDPHHASFDPSAAFVKGAVSASINSYVRETLGYDSDHPYRVMASVAWNYTQYANQFVSMEGRLARALVQNPRLQIMLQVGRADLVVPQDVMRYSIAQMPIPASLRANIRFEEYESGHMMYFHAPDAAKFRADTVKFIQESLK